MIGSVGVLSFDNAFAEPPWVAPLFYKYDGDRITYKQYSWNDFKGTPHNSTDKVTGEEKIFSAVTYWSLDRKWIQTNIGSNSSCEYKLTSVDAITSLVSSKSYVKEDKKSDYLLNHEQGHMDIAEIHARAFEKELMNKIFPCPSEIYESDIINNLTNDVFYKHKDAIDSMQNLYDKQTEHDRNKQVQSDWDEKIQCMLNNNGPSEHCLSLKAIVSTPEITLESVIEPTPAVTPAATPAADPTPLSETNSEITDKKYDSKENPSTTIAQNLVKDYGKKIDVISKQLAPQTQSKIKSYDSKISREQSQYDEYLKQYDYYEGKTLSASDEQKFQKIVDKLNSQNEKITSLIDERNTIVLQSDEITEEKVETLQLIKQTEEKAKKQTMCFLFWCW